MRARSMESAKSSSRLSQARPSFSAKARPSSWDRRPPIREGASFDTLCGRLGVALPKDRRNIDEQRFMRIVRPQEDATYFRSRRRKA